MSGLELADTNNAEITVLLVTFNAWDWTERALRALRDNTDPVYETVIVDNLSTDETRGRLAELRGARIVLNDANRGFGAAACQGALLARTSRLLLLNSDALVEPGWLRPLLATLDDSPTVAAVTPRLLHTDGRLQEAGSMVWGEGACDNFGDGDDPARPEYRFRRDVDYASAACLLVRADAFADAGGFDDAYHPAYYEDTDLAMRWRAMGLRVVYEPRSTVVHRRWASSGDRSGMVDLLLRNRAVFVERWGREIGDRPPRPASPRRRDFAAIRDAACGERVLVVDHEATSAPGLAFQVAQAFARRMPWWRTTLVSIGDDAEGDAANRLRQEGVEVAGFRNAGAAAGFLAERRGHHTAALVGARVAPAVVDDIRRTQTPVVLARIEDPDETAATEPAGVAAAVVGRGRAGAAGGDATTPWVVWDEGGAAAVPALARLLGLAGC